VKLVIMHIKNELKHNNMLKYIKKKTMTTLSNQLNI